MSYGECLVCGDLITRIDGEEWGEWINSKGEVFCITDCAHIPVKEMSNV
jgi:hypothetical protein